MSKNKRAPHFTLGCSRPPVLEWSGGLLFEDHTVGKIHSQREGAGIFPEPESPSPESPFTIIRVSDAQLTAFSIEEGCRYAHGVTNMVQAPLEHVIKASSGPILDLHFEGKPLSDCSMQIVERNYLHIVRE